MMMHNDAYLKWRVACEEYAAILEDTMFGPESGGCKVGVWSFAFGPVEPSEDGVRGLDNPEKSMASGKWAAACGEYAATLDAESTLAGKCDVGLWRFSFEQEGGSWVPAAFLSRLDKRPQDDGEPA
jgi:hypothetical protein